MEWKPIETAPKNGTFIAWLGRDKLPEAMIFHGKTYWDSMADGAPKYMPREDALRATHWMPLPPAPNA